MSDRTFFVRKATMKNGQAQFRVVKKIPDYSIAGNISYREVEGYDAYTEETCRALADRLEGRIITKTEYL